MKSAFGLFLVLGGLALACWLGGYTMLYKGVKEAIACLNAWSIVKAALWEWGLVPGFAVIKIGLVLLGLDEDW